MLEGDPPSLAGCSKGSFGAISERPVLARPEGPRNDVRCVRGVVADANPGPWGNVKLGVQPEEGFGDGRHVTSVVARDLGAQEQARAAVEGDRAKKTPQGVAHRRGRKEDRNDDAPPNSWAAPPAVARARAVG
eukprot:2966157-Alexandrium_andersonii.AAC.1